MRLRRPLARWAAPPRAIGLATVGAAVGIAAAAAIVKRAVPTRGDAQSDEVALVAIYDGVQLGSRAQAFTGGSMLAWFGGIAVDLREATLAPGAHLSVYALFGGVAVRVPPDWRIESRLHVLGGGVDVPGKPESAAAPTLTLDGLAVFGGVSVRARAAEGSG